MQKNEDRIQHEFIMWFGQTWPEYRQLMFEVNNDTHSAGQANYRKSKGMISGVSDLILILPNNGKVVAIELKAPGSVHKIDHIKNQLDWGNRVVKNGGFYFMTSQILVLQRHIHSLIYHTKSGLDGYSIIDAIDLSKKTVKF